MRILTKKTIVNMKKNLITLAVVVAAFVAALPAQAQVKFGVKAGLNVNSVSLQGNLADNLDSKNRTGCFAGLTADVTIPHAGLGADISLLYDNKVVGASSEDAATGDIYESNKTLHYITLPINAKYTIGLSSIASVYLATGPQFSWNVGDRKWKSQDITEGWELNKSEFSWNVGAGATVFSHVRVGYNYNIGIGNTAEASILNTAGQAVKGKLKNNTHQISLTYFF